LSLDGLYFDLILRFYLIDLSILDVLNFLELILECIELSQQLLAFIVEFSCVLQLLGGLHLQFVFDDLVFLLLLVQ
jgi:hypothetical protein